MVLSRERKVHDGRKSMLRRKCYDDDTEDNVFVSSRSNPVGLDRETKRVDRIGNEFARRNYKCKSDCTRCQRNDYEIWSVRLCLKLADIAFIGLSRYLHWLHFIHRVLVKYCPHSTSSGFLNRIFKSISHKWYVPSRRFSNLHIDRAIMSVNLILSPRIGLSSLTRIGRVKVTKNKRNNVGIFLICFLTAA